MNSILINSARAFAEFAHKGQFRKWIMDGFGQQIPYFTHPCRVAYAVTLYPGSTPEMIAAAYLHDVIEDCGVEPFQIQFGEIVATLVSELTNQKQPEKITSREVRKALDHLRLSKVSREAKIIKMLDRIDNLNEMSDASGSFRRKYAFEAIALCSVIGDADTKLQWQVIDLAITMLRGLDAEPSKLDPKTP